MELCEVTRYDFKDLQILLDFTRVPAYHGNVSDVLFGKHGFNLCTQEIRENFHDTLTVDRRAFIIQRCLLSEDYSELSPKEYEIIQSYLRWRQEGVAELHECLWLFMKQSICAKTNLVVPNALIFERSSRISLMILWIRLKTFKGTTLKMDKVVYQSSKAHQQNFVIPEKIDGILHILEKLQEHGKKLRNTYDFEKCSRNNRQHKTKNVLRKEFLEKFPQFLKWPQECRLFAFASFCIPWLHFDYFVMTEKSTQTIPLFIERNVTN